MTRSLWLSCPLGQALDAELNGVLVEGRFDGHDFDILVRNNSCYARAVFDIFELRQVQTLEFCFVRIRWPAGVSEKRLLGGQLSNFSTQMGALFRIKVDYVQLTSPTNAFKLLPVVFEPAAKLPFRHMHATVLWSQSYLRVSDAAAPQLLASRALHRHASSITFGTVTRVQAQLYRQPASARWLL